MNDEGAIESRQQRKQDFRDFKAVIAMTALPIRKLGTA